MSEATTETTPLFQSPSNSFLSIWWSAISRPTLANYQALILEPDSGAGRGLWWIFWVSVLQVTMTTTGTYITNMFTTPEEQPGNPAGTTLGGTLIEGCLGSVGVVPLFAIVLGISHYVASRFGGKGSYRKLVFLASAHTAPLSLIVTAISAAPLVGGLLLTIFAIPYLIYSVYLSSLTIKAVHAIKWFEAFFAGFLAPVLIGFSFGCCIAVFSLFLS